MSQKIVFFDIDGTIWDEHMVIPESTRLAITKLKENGHKAFLCTGRARAAVVSKELFDMGIRVKVDDSEDNNCVLWNIH